MQVWFDQNQRSTSKSIGDKLQDIHELIRVWGHLLKTHRSFCQSLKERYIYIYICILFFICKRVVDQIYQLVPLICLYQIKKRKKIFIYPQILQCRCTLQET